MRKFSFILVFAFIIILSSCKTETVKPDFTNVCFNADITVEDEKFNADVEINENSKTVISLISPNEMRNTVYSIDGNDVSVDYMGTGYNDTIDSFPNGSVIKIIYTVFNDAKNKSADVKKDKTVIKSNVSGYEYTLILNSENLPQKLNVDNYNTQMKFNNATKKGSTK